MGVVIKICEARPDLCLLTDEENATIKGIIAFKKLNQRLMDERDKLNPPRQRPKKPNR